MPLPTPEPSCRGGLLTREKAAVPLTAVSVDADITAFCARVTVTQRYVNTETQPIEAVYVFPLDEGAAVCGFEALIDGTRIVGEVRERDEAFATYDDAMRRGDSAVLLDEERPDVFQASIGNLPPGGEVVVTLTYVSELAAEGSGVRFTVPTTVAPRYAPAADRKGVGRPDSDALNPPVASTVPYGLTLRAVVRMTGAITRLESPSHPVSVSFSGSQATVTLSARETALDRDFVLAIDAEGLDRPSASIERHTDGRHAVAVSLAPVLTRHTVPAEVIFVVDRSGSMNGTSIAEVRNALRLCLRSLEQGCRFNIIGFGSTLDPLFPASVPYGDDSLARADAHVSTMAADLDGTEMLPALEAALSDTRGDLRREVVLLTDGVVTNTDAVISLARAHRSRARVFTFGIGAGPSPHLLRAVARAGGGAAEFIHPGERIEPKVLRQFARLLSPALENVRMDWNGLPVTTVPSEIPPVWSGSRLVVYGFVDGVLPASGTARLRADGPDGPVTFEVPVDPAAAVDGTTIATLAARVRIRELEEGDGWTPHRGSQQRDRMQGAAVAEITRLATRYGLMSRETSYVAVEHRATPVEGDVQLRRVPVALTSGWGGITVVPKAMPRLSKMPSGRLTSMLDKLRRAEPPDHASLHGGLFGDTGYGEGPARLTAPTRESDALQALVTLQRADGSWDLDRALARALGVPLGVLESLMPVGASEARARRAWATALAVTWLHDRMDRRIDEWGLLARKAERWLDALEPSGGRWLDAARAAWASPALTSRV